MNICDWLDRWAGEKPEATALRFDEQAWTYPSLARDSDEYARCLQAGFGVARGDRVAYLGLNSPDFLLLLFACARLGAIICPLNWRLAGTELARLLQHAEPRVVVADPDLQQDWLRAEDFRGCHLVSMLDDAAAGWSNFHQAPASGELASVSDADDDPALLVYTSGTTGEPKGALLTHAALQANAKNSVLMHGLDTGDHALVSLPFFHVGGLNILTTPVLYSGGTVTLQRVFDASAMLEAMAGGGITRVPIVSAQMPPILGLPAWKTAHFPDLRSVTTGASPVSPEIYGTWRDKGVEVLQVYGATETCPIAINTVFGEELDDVSTAGRAAGGCKIRLVDDEGRDVESGKPGEIVIAGDNLMQAYWRNPDATAEALRDGWYASGDIGYQDHDGYYYVVDRKKDLIISGGENIFPAEIETLLLEQDGIADAAVVGRPDARWGEVPVAVIKLGPDAQTDKHQILAALDGRLGRYKIPKEVFFVEEFPRNSVGKIQKFLLRERLFRR